MPMGMVFSSLARRTREFSKYVCITGGEPTIQRDLLSFVKFLNLGLKAKVKLDTNGTNPMLLKKLIPYLDYIAMDIKELPIKKEVLESIMLIQDTGIDHHFRTTVVPGIVDEDLIKVISGLMKNDKYVLQQFTPSDNIIDPSFRNLEPYNRETLEEFRNILLKRCKEVSILG
jgi:pyruvate formate lyase activating enzyme